MTPKILEYEDGRVRITVEAFTIPEVKDLIDKYGDEAEPYLSYVHSMSAIDSPYINLPDDEKTDTVIYDVKSTLGDFDETDDLLERAVDKLKRLYMSPMMSLVLEMEQEIHKLRAHLRNTPIQNDNMKDRIYIMEKIDKIATAYTKVKEQADKELMVATKGDHELGGY